ncbi:hypothetical protein Chor_012810 [Crotalus horridus]
MKHKPVYSGEPAKIKCPLFVAFVKHNYSTAHAAGLTLIWYWIGLGQDLEEPINFRHPDNHISKEKDMLWFRPALLNDTGNYTCMLRNASYCSKIAVPLEVVSKDPGSCLSEAVKPETVLMYFDAVKQNLTCPEVGSFLPAGIEPQVRWYKEWRKASFSKGPPETEEDVRGNASNTINGEQLLLRCEVMFTFLEDSPQEVCESPLSIGGTKIEKYLFVPRMTEKDLKRNFTCFAQNNRGLVHAQAVVRMKPPVLRYTVELACGLGATVLLVVILTVIYHFYWLEMVLFYRAHFGTDETILDGKEYDVYVSYARNTEEEDFVLLTLRGVLENEYGYKLCIFDRDSLPGGIVTDETLSFIQRSRRLLVVFSPNYVLRGTQALLEFKAGLENMASQGTIKVILVQYKPVKKSQVKELRRAKTVLTVIKWKGEKSRYPSGRFWKELLVKLPVKSRTKNLWGQQDLIGLSPKGV